MTPKKKTTFAWALWTVALVAGAGGAWKDYGVGQAAGWVVVWCAISALALSQGGGDDKT